MFTKKIILYISLIFITLLLYISILYYSDGEESYHYNPKIVSIHWKTTHKEQKDKDKEQNKFIRNPYQKSFKGSDIFIFNEKELISFRENKAQVLSLFGERKEFKINVEEFIRKEKKNTIEKFLVKSFIPELKYYSFLEWESIINFTYDNQKNLYVIFLRKKDIGEGLFLVKFDPQMNLIYKIHLKELLFGYESVLSIHINHKAEIYLITKEIQENHIYHNIYHHNSFGQFIHKFPALENLLQKNEKIEQLYYIPNSFNFFIISNIHREDPDKKIFLSYKKLYSYSLIFRKIKLKKKFFEESKNISIFKIFDNGNIYLSLPYYHIDRKADLNKHYYFKIFNFKNKMKIKNKIFKIQSVNNDKKNISISDNGKPILYEEKDNLFQIYYYK